MNTYASTARHYSTGTIQRLAKMKIYTQIFFVILFFSFSCVGCVASSGNNLKVGKGEWELLYLKLPKVVQFDGILYREREMFVIAKDEASICELRAATGATNFDRAIDIYGIATDVLATGEARRARVKGVITTSAISELDSDELVLKLGRVSSYKLTVDSYELLEVVYFRCNKQPA